MFSKSRINEPGPKAETETTKAPEALMTKPAMDFTPSSSKGKATASILSSDLTVVGNLRTTGDIQVEGTVEGDIRAHLLTVGESATIRGEIVADDIVVNGRVISLGRVSYPTLIFGPQLGVGWFIARWGVTPFARVGALFQYPTFDATVIRFHVTAGVEVRL